MWKDLKIVHGKPRHSQSQGSVERANQDVENMLGTWLQDNKTKKWSEGIKFIQFMKNRAYHHGIKSSPYEAMFGSMAKIGLNNCILPMHVVAKLKTEEDLEKALNTIEKEENKEKNSDNEVITVENEENLNSEDALSSRKHSIHTKRNESVHNLEMQANKMKSISKRRFCEGNIGESVKIKISDVDRARSDLRSILAVIMSDGNYKLDTTKGKLQHYYQFTICKEKFVNVDEVPDIQLSLREVARLFSNLGGQGYDRCTCGQKCETRRCKCKAAGILCNTKYHNGLGFICIGMIFLQLLITYFVSNVHELALAENLEIVENTKSKLGQNKGPIAEKIDKKYKNVLEKNTGLKAMSTIRNILNGNNVDEDFPNLTPGEVTKFRYAKITSCDVERSFSKYKNILRSNRRSFIFENLKHHVVVSCNSFE
ncbi:hypothetical protein QTP88_001345 [Uroleucon formosanum]